MRKKITPALTFKARSLVDKITRILREKFISLEIKRANLPLILNIASFFYIFTQVTPPPPPHAQQSIQFANQHVLYVIKQLIT
jgi:hypothetical protein